MNSDELTQKVVEIYRKTKGNSSWSDSKDELKRIGCTRVTADWKAIQDLADSFVRTLRQMGAIVIEDPDCVGSDQYGYIIYHPMLQNTSGWPTGKDQCGDPYPK